MSIKKASEKKTSKKRLDLYDLRDEEGRPRPLLTLGLPRWRGGVVDGASEICWSAWWLFLVTGTVCLSIPNSLTLGVEKDGMMKEGSSSSLSSSVVESSSSSVVFEVDIYIKHINNHIMNKNKLNNKNF